MTLHAIQTEVKGQRTGEVEIRLVCICGEVFARGLFVVDDRLHRAAVIKEGWSRAEAHRQAQRQSRPAPADDPQTAGNPS